MTNLMHTIFQFTFIKIYFNQKVFSVYCRYIWLVTCSILNIIWTVCLGATIADYVLCGPFRNILPPDSWNENKEALYKVIIEHMADCYIAFKFYIKGFFKLRQTNTNLVIFIIPT